MRALAQFHHLSLSSLKSYKTWDWSYSSPLFASSATSADPSGDISPLSAAGTMCRNCAVCSHSHYHGGRSCCAKTSGACLLIPEGVSFVQYKYAIYTKIPHSLSIRLLSMTTHPSAPSPVAAWCIFRLRVLRYRRSSLIQYLRNLYNFLLFA